jgi:ribosomal protein S18 acetylase RimI-like enzyme
MITIGLDRIDHGDFVLVAKGNDKQLGHITFVLNVFDNKTAIITDLEVHPNHRGKGIGTALVSEAVKHITKFLNVKRVLMEDGSANGETSKIAFKLGFKYRVEAQNLKLELKL